MKTEIYNVEGIETEIEVGRTSKEAIYRSVRM